MKLDLVKVEWDARTAAIRHAQKIAEEANWRPMMERAPYAGTCASLVLQNLTVSMLVSVFKPGSAEGEAQIRNVYAQALKDALARWHKADLKERFG